VFSHRYSNALTRILGRLAEGDSLCLGNSLRGSPVVAEDAARVVSALADQLSTDADVWGIYHYCSSDVTNCYEFAESMLASATQYAEFQSGAVEMEKPGESTATLNRALDCAKIRHTFAIKQVGWRSFIADSVKNYFLSAQQ
jgi:dTDP-4-dehydrorhamnose reductase